MINQLSINVILVHCVASRYSNLVPLDLNVVMTHHDSFI